MEFKLSDLYDVGHKASEVASPASNKKWYPTIELSEKNLKSLKNLDFKQNVTIHAHGKITGKRQYNDDPANFTIELHKVGIKPGLNPRAKWMSDSDYDAFERCLGDFKGKGNKYAVCLASIKERKGKVKKEALKRL
jgi:hypothetical protein